MENFKKIIRIISELHKFRITFSVTLTTLAGFTLTAGTIDNRIFLPLLGIFFLQVFSPSLHLASRHSHLPDPGGAGRFPV